MALQGLDGKTPDYNQAAQYFLRAANAGDDDAAYSYGVMLRDGKGGPRNLGEAVHWLKRASDDGIVAGQVEYAIMLFNGEGVKKDQAEGREDPPHRRVPRQPDRPEPGCSSLCQRRNAAKRYGQGRRLEQFRQGGRTQRRRPRCRHRQSDPRRAEPVHQDGPPTHRLLTAQSWRRPRSFLTSLLASAFFLRALPPRNGWRRARRIKEARFAWRPNSSARVGEVTYRIVERSRRSRQAYLARIDAAVSNAPSRKRLGCANFAHGFAACEANDKEALREGTGANLAIVTAYNDMLSAHQPYARFPDLIRQAARAVGGSAQVAGGVPAMCDGVTQGEKGMELSLFSRDVIALSTAVALSHDMFDAAVYLGICDKIVPGLIIGALSFGHLPAVFLPAGPMPSGLGNAEKSKVRQLYAEGKASRADLLEAEAEAYHAPGTCTFYGTANTNQMLMEIMGLHLPGSSFVNPNTPLRDALTMLGVKRALEITALGNQFTPIGRVIDERAIVNGVVGLHATGGSTNLTIHLVAMAARGGHRAPMGGFRRSCRSDAASDPDLSEWKGGREPFPRRRRHGPPDPRTSRRRARARRRADRLGRARRLCGRAAP